MKILVTGGAGYIGSFMVKRLLEDGYEVVVIDSLERGVESAIPQNVKLYRGDIKDEGFLSSVFDENDFNGIFHFAGLISMAESMENPGIYFENNFYSTLRLLDTAVKHGVKNFIFSSTAGVYGNPNKIPIPEDHDLNPTNPYGESKLMVEKLLKWYNAIYSLNFASLRYFNASGASMDGALGENHEPETHIIPLAIKAIQNNSPFNLYGTDYNTEDGTCIRDYIHVIDLVEAHILAFGKINKDPGGFFYNIGTGRGYSNREVIEEIENISGQKITIVDRPRRPGDAEALIADPGKIKEELGFSPKYSDLNTIVKTAWEFYNK
jgi:UDP-glucose 4-epimerase